ncbi:DUF3006 domain-containing protein [Anaerosalibacter sp. Marseille-P3206]|uniref:DUF3006 domain-containing protein n=1 Tax=Anaerosalibacter sp. Marseille-P3206 TaxID=1871005 RepID=UPI0009868AA8|nr:DUF3006 domain-containing protein [Anaerosalibacter sp. Marseille-P3206]
MRGVVDRIEEEYVVLEVEGEMIDIKIELMPEGIKEGDIVKLIDGNYIILSEETAKRKKSIEDLFNDLKENH